MTRHLTIHPTKIRQAPFSWALIFVAIVAAALSLTSVAHAGSWIEVSCENPSLSSAPSQGWTSFTTGSPGFGSNNSTNCGTNSSMLAVLSSFAPASVYSGENLQFTPPAGSTLVGGEVDASLYADGHGLEASGTAIAYTPNFVYDSSNIILQCAYAVSACQNGTTDFSGIITLPANRGGNFYIGAGCGGAEHYECNEGGSNSAWSLVQVWWANFTLANSSTPGAGTIGGALLNPKARGTQDAILTATDPGGPGVYAVSLQADGKTLYSGTPDTNSGKCLPVGSSSGTLMFDYSQPCKQNESVDLPVNTASLTDGSHTLKISVTDAAQNTSVVYDNTITTANAPANSSLPAIVTPSQVSVGTALTVQAGSWSAPTGAGNVTYSYRWEDCDTQGNNCQIITGAQNTNYTPAPSDVGRTLRVLVTAADNDGTETAISPASNSVLPQNGSLGAPTGPGTSGKLEEQTIINIPGSNGSNGSNGMSGSGGATGANGANGSIVAGEGARNGTVAGETAQLQLGVPAVISRAFAHSGLKITGRLLTSGRAIGGATLDILQRIAGTNTLRVIGHAKTRANGTFSANLAGAPSRLIEIAYRAQAADPEYAATAKISESSEASVRLTIKPHHTSTKGTITLRGTVKGPIPAHGVIIDPIVHYLGHWIPITTPPRTDKHGEFTIKYKFQGAAGRFPFRIMVPSGQTGFPYARGSSRTVDVTTS